MQSALAMLILDAPLIALMIAVITRTTAERFGYIGRLEGLATRVEAGREEELRCGSYSWGVGLLTCGPLAQDCPTGQ